MRFKFTPVCSSKRQLQKGTYRILKKMHDLERGKKFNRIYGKKIGEMHTIISCVGAIIILFQEVKVGNSANIELENIISQEISCLERLREKILERIEISKPFPKGTLSHALTKHTKLFNSISGHSISVKEIDNKNWQDICLYIINIWGNKI